MHFITGKHMPRRTFLRGVGATVALPFLDAMVPSGFGRGVEPCRCDRSHAARVHRGSPWVGGL